jgi:hypothetical protein
LDKDDLDGAGVPSNIILNCRKIVFNRIFLILDLFGFFVLRTGTAKKYCQMLKIFLIGSPWQNIQDLNNLRNIIRTTRANNKLSKWTLSTKLLMALQE